MAQQVEVVSHSDIEFELPDDGLSEQVSFLI